jgi:hypothetical protein
MRFEEYMFINTIADIREKLHRGEPYFLIRGAGLLRHLLVDSTPLIDLVNREYELKITYRVLEPDGVQTGGTDLSKIFLNQPALYLPQGIPIMPGRKFSEVNRDYFLGMKCFNFQGHQYSVKDVIKFTSHVR